MTIARHALGTTLLLACAGIASTALGDERPNIVLIVIDDLGYGDLGCYGSSVHETPHIDRLAEGGMRFTDFHTNGAVCSPTRAALMTGQYQQRSGIEAAIGFTRDLGMPLEKTTIAELLADAGYVCGLFGKWHLGHVGRFGPNDQGFDLSVCSNNSPDYHTHVSRVGELDWYKDHELHEESGYLTDLVTRHTNTFIATNRERPFFAFVSHIAVHFPFQGPDDPPLRTLGKIWHDRKYGPLPEEAYRRAYRDMLTEVDRSVGAVVDAIELLELRRRTLILVTSDNGAYSWVGCNGPFRGQKGDLFEGGHRVPMIANWPGRIEPGTVTDATSMTMDVAPTLLAVAGIDVAEGVAFDGLDLSGVLFDARPLPERTLFWRFRNTHAVRRGDWKYLSMQGKPSLYHLGNDPGEQDNLAAQEPKLVAQLQEAYAQWEREVKHCEPRRREPFAR